MSDFSQYGFAAARSAPVGNAFMLAAFAALIPVNLYTGIRYKSSLFMSLVIAGLLAEVFGHVGKILLGINAGRLAYFTIYMLGTLWGPVFVGAAIYQILPRVFVIYGQEFSPVSRPGYIGIILLVFDVFTLAFQSVGIAFASNGSTQAEVRSVQAQQPIYMDSSN